ncbi:spermatogenesis-associated protein 31H1 isoform X3 [Rattus norvegicus]
MEKLTVSQFEDSRMNFMENDLTCVSGLPMGWTQEYILWSIDKSLQQIFQHLENASSTLMELGLPESHEASSSSISDTMARELASPCCYCEKGKCSTDYSISSESSNHSSILSCLPIFSERTTWQSQRHGVPDSSEKELPVSGSQSTPVPTFQLMDTKKSDLFQNFAVIPPVQAQSSFISSILQSLDPCKQEKTEDKRKNHLLSGHGSSSVLNERLGPFIWAPLRVSPLVRGELEGHISQKVSTLKKQVVPLPVKKSWDILNHLMDAQGVPKQKIPKTQLPPPTPQRTEPNTYRSSDVPSIHLHVNIGVNSEVNRTEARMSKSLTSNKQLESKNDHQIIRYNPLVISMDTPSSRNLEINAVQEETTLVEKDPKPVLELNIEQRVIGLPEERIPLHKAQETNVGLTPKVPCSAADSIKVTPMALLQVMGSMGMIPDSHSEVIDSVGKTKDKTDLPQPPNQAETVNMPPETSYPVIESIKVASPQRETSESESMTSRLHQITDNTKVTPVALFHVLDSRALINELCSRVIESAGIAPKPQYQVMKSVGVDTLHKDQAEEPAKVSPGPHQTVFKARERIPQPQHEVTETLNMDSGSQNQATKQTRFTPSSLQPTLPPPKVLDSSRVILEPSENSICALKLSSVVQGSPTGVTIPPQAGLITQSVAQAKESLELPSATQVQVRDSIEMTLHQGTEYVSLTPKLPHQVMDPLEFTPWHQDLDCSEISPRQSHIRTEPMELTSDIWPQRKSPTEMTPSHHQITESKATAPEASDQGTIPIGMSQQHQLTESGVVPATPKLQEIEYFGGETTPQPKVIESVNLSPELQDVNSKNLVPDPRSEGMKPVDISKDLVSEMVKDGPLTLTVVSTDVAPEQHQQSVQSAKLTAVSQLQTEKPVPSAPESQLQDVKSAQLTIEPQLQSVQSAGLALNPQVQSNISVNLIPCSQSQGMEGVGSALPQEVQEDIKMVALTPRLPLEDIEPANLAPEPCSQNTSSDEITHVPLLEDTNIPLVDCRSLIPETLVESMKISELTTHLYAVKPSDVDVGPDSSYSFPEPEGLTEQQQASEARVTSDTCHPRNESAESTQSSVRMTPAPLSQTSESTEMSLPPLLDTLETRTQVLEEMKETPELQSTIKDTLDLLPESEVPTINPEVMAPEPQFLDENFTHVMLEPCSEVTNPSEISLYEYTESTGLTLPEVDDTQGTTVETYPEMGSQGLNLEPRVQIEEPESLAEKLKCEELTSEPSVLVEPTELTTGPTPHIIDVIPGPQIHKVKSRQINKGLELRKAISVDLVQKSSIGVVDPEKAKPELGLPSLSPKGSSEGIPNVKSVDWNLGQEQPIVKSGLIPGPQLQSVRFPKLHQGLLLQGENAANSISAPPHYSVKSDEAISYSQMPEIGSSGFIPGAKVPEPQQPHVKSTDVYLGPCLQDVRFSDSVPESKHHGFTTQFIPGFPLQGRISQGFMPLTQEPKFEDRKLALPTQGSEFHSIKFARQASELQRPCMISEKINTGPREQDTKFSELASRPKLQGVIFGEQISGSIFVSGSSMTPELKIHSPKLAKTTPGLQDSRQMSCNSGPWLQDVKFLDGTPGTLSQGVKTSEINSGPHLECVKIFELTTQPEGQGMKPELIVQESPFQDVKRVTGNQEPSFEDKMSYKVISEPQRPMAEPVKLDPGRHLANVDHPELTRRPQTQGIAPSELIKGQLLGHVKSAERNTVSKQEALTSVELTPGPHLGDIKSTKLKTKSELEHIRSMLSSPGMQAGDRKLEGVPPGSSLKGLKPKLLPSKPKIEDRKPVILTVEECLKRIKSTVVSPNSSLRGDMKSVKLIPGSKVQELKNKGLTRGTHVQDVNAMDLKLDPTKRGDSPVTFVPKMLLKEKSMEVCQGPQLQGIKPKELTSQSQMQDRKPVVAPCLKQQSLKPITAAKIQEIQGVKFVDFTSTKQYKGIAPMDLTVKSRQDDQITVKSLERKDGIFEQKKKRLESENTLPMESALEPKPADTKPIEINSELQFKDTTSFELSPEPVVQSVKAEELQNELQGPSMQPCQLTAGSQMHQKKALEPTLAPQLQGVETMALNTEPRVGSTRTIQWIPISEFQSEKGVGSDSRSQSQHARPTELKPPIPWRGVRSSELTARSKIQGEKSVASHLEPQLQGEKTSPLAIGLQEPKTLNLTSEPQPQGVTTEELNKEPQAEHIRSVQWIPLQEFHSARFLGFNSGPPSQGVKRTERKPFIKLGGGKPSEMTQGPKPQGKTVDVNLVPQEQCVRTLQLSPGPELQKGGDSASSSAAQPQCVETVPLHHGPQLENAKSVLQDKTLMQNLGLQPQSVTSKELKPLAQERDMKTSEESTTRPKTEPSRSAQECLSPGLKTIDLKSELPFRNMKACDPILRSMISNVKPMTFKPRLPMEDKSSPELTPGIQSQEAKPLKSSPETQPQDMTSSVFKQESQSSEVKSGVSGQGSQSQNNKNIVLKSEKPSGLALQTKPQGLKSEMKSEPQGQSAKCSDLTPETKSQNTQFKFSASSPLKSKPFTNLIMGTKIGRVKPDPKPGPQSQGIKPDSVLKTKPQEMETEDYGSGPQLQDLQSLRTIMGVKVQDVKSMAFSPRPRLESLPPEVITEKNVLGVKPAEIKPSPKLQGEKPEITPRKLFLGTKSLELDSGLNLQDLKYPELIMGMKLQGVDSMEQHLTRIKPSEVIPEINSQGVTAVDFDSGPQTPNKRPSEFVQGEKLQDKESVEFNQGLKLQSMIVESVPETKPQDGESVKLNLGPQMPDKKYSKSVLGTILQDGRSTEANSGPYLQGVKPSEGISGDTVQKEKPVGPVFQPLEQNEDSFKWIFSKALDGKPLQFKLPSELQDRRLSKLKPDLQDMKPEAFNPGLKLEDVKAEPTNPQTTENEEVSYDADLHVVGFSELVPIYNVVPSGLKARNQKRNEKPHKLSQKLQLQSMKPYMPQVKSSDLCTKLQHLRSMEFNPGPQLQDVKSFELGLGTGTQPLGFNPGPQLQDVKPFELGPGTGTQPLGFNPGPQLQDVKSFELGPGTGTQPLGFNPGPQLQDVKSFELGPGTGTQSLGFNPGPQLQDVKSFELGPGTGTQSLGFNPGPQLQDVKSFELGPGTGTQSLGFNPGPQLQDVKPFELGPGTGTQSLGFNPGPQLQDVKSFELGPGTGTQSLGFNPGPQLQDVKPFELGPGTGTQPLGFNPGPQLQDVKSFELGPGTGTQSLGFNPGSQLQEIKPPAVGTEVKLLEESPLEFKHEPRLQCSRSYDWNHSKNVMAPNTGIQVVESSELHPGPDLPGIKPKVFRFGSHLEDVNSACTPNINFQHVSSSGYISGPYLQDVDSSTCIPEPNGQCINSECNPGIHLPGMNSSSCFSGSKLQCVASTGSNPESHLQDINSTECTPEPSPQCANSSAHTPGSNPQCADSPACISEPSPQYANSSACTPGPSPQCENSSACTSEPSPLCENSSVCSQGSSSPCVNSTECTPEPHLQGVNPSVYTPGQNPLCENSNRYNLGPLFQGMNFCTFPPPQILCVNPVWCNTRIHWQDINSSACNLRQESQSVNSIGYNPGPHLQALKFQEQLKDLKSELTPESNDLGIAPGKYNPGPQHQGMNSSGFNPESKPQCISSVKPSSGPQLQTIKTFELTPGSESQSTKSVLLNSGSPSQGVRPSNLMLGAEFQKFPLMKNQLGSWQQSVQPISAVRPQSNGVNSVVLPIPPPEARTSPEKSTKTLFCANAVKLTPGYGLPDLRSKMFSPEPCFQNVQDVQWKPGSQSQSVGSSELISSHGSQHAMPSLIPKPCFQDTNTKQPRIGPQQQSLNGQLFPSEEKPVMAASPQFTRKLLGPALTSVKFSNLSLKPQQQNKKSLAFTSEPKCQNVKHVKLSSVSLPDTEKPVQLPPKSILQSVKRGNLMPQTTDPVTKSSEVKYRPKRQVVDFSEMSMKPRSQVPKSVNFMSPPICQDVESLDMAKGLGHESQEMMERSMSLSSKPTDKGIESLEMPLEMDIQVTELVDLTPTPSDQDSESSEPNLQKSHQIPKTPELHSWLWSQFQGFKKLQTKEIPESDKVTLDFKNHDADTIGLTCEARQQGEEFPRMSPKPVNKETGFVETSPRSCLQDLGLLGLGSKKRSQGGQSVVSTPRPVCHTPDFASGITPGPEPHILKSRNLASMPWLQKASSELSWKQTSQVVGNSDSVELTFGTRQPGGVAAKLRKLQNLSLENASITSLESPDPMINFVGISPKPRDQVTESAKTQLPVPQSVALPKVSESVEVIPGPPLQVTKSVMIPETTSQESKYNDLTPRTHDVVSSAFAPSLWLQNVQSKKLIREPTHQVSETIRRQGFRVIKTVLIPKPLLLVVKSEEVAPGPCPQVVEPIGLTMRSNIKVNGCLNLLPKPHLQDLVKPMALTSRAESKVTSAELILPQTSLLKEPTVLIHEQRLQAEKSLGLKTESPKVMKTEGPNQGLVCQNKDSKMITSTTLQAENYLSRFIHSPSIQFLSSGDQTTELEHLQGSGVPEVPRAFSLKNLGVGILQSSKSYADTIMIKSSVLPLVLQNLPSDKTGDTEGTSYPEIWSMNILSKAEAEKEKMEEFQRYSSYSLRLLSEEFQAGLGARRSSIRSFLGIQQNVWESHVSRQRLPRRYLSSMLMLGNVLGTTMERKPCSQSFLTEGSTMDICQSIQNLFGVPAELMEFSQSLLERGPRTISQTSVVKNYIQRHILCHSNEKKMPLKMWTRGSTSSIIQQYSGTRVGVKKTSSKLSDILQEVTEHVSVSCTRAPFPALMKSESTLEILYTREDSVSMEQGKIPPCVSPTRTFASQHSLKTSSLSQSKTDISEQLQLLKDLQLKIAGKLLRSQIPHNVPPPLATGLVLKYPICLQCGRCSGFNCCHKLQSAYGPYLLIYPQLHLLSTPEGHGEIRLHLGFRLRTGKRPQVSKYHGRNRADARKSAASPSRRKARFSTTPSKSPTPRGTFQSGSSPSPASVQFHTQQKQWYSPGVVGKATAKDYEFCQVHSVSESEYESNQDEKWVKSSLRKASVLTYPVKKITKGPKMQNTRLYKISTKEAHSRTLKGVTRNRIGTTQTNSVSTKRQPKKSSQPKFIQLLFHGLRQAFQAAHRIVTFTGQKLEYKMRPDNLWSVKNLHPKQRAKDYNLMGDSKGTRTPGVRHRSTSATPKQKDKLQGASERYRQAQQPKQVSPLVPKPSQLPQTMVCEKDVFNQATSVPEPVKRIQNVYIIAKKTCSNEISTPESKNVSKVGAKFQAQERIVSNHLLKGTLQSHFEKKPINKEEQQGLFGEKTLCNKPSERTHSRLPQRTHRRSLSERRHHSRPQRRHSSPSDRTLRSLSERSHRSPSQRNSLSSSVRTYHSLSDRSHHSLFKGRGHSPSRRNRRSPSRRSPQNSLRRSPHSPSRRQSRNLSGSSHHSPSWSSLRSPSGRPRSPSRRSPRSPSRSPRSPSRSPSSPLRRNPHRRSGRSPHRRSGRSPHRRSGRSPHSLSGRSPHRRSGRSLHSLSGRSPHRRSGRSPRRPLERRRHSPSVKKSLHSLSEGSQQSPSSLRCPSPLQRSLGSHSEKSPGSFSERSISIPSGWKRHSSGVTLYTSSKPRLHRHSSRLTRSHSERTHSERSHYSPSESRHSYSDGMHRTHSVRTHHCHHERPYHSLKERLKHSSLKERVKRSLAKEIMSSRDHTKKCKSWTSLEA